MIHILKTLWKFIVCKTLLYVNYIVNIYVIVGIFFNQKHFILFKENVGNIKMIISFMWYKEYIILIDEYIDKFQNWMINKLSG